MGSGLEFWFRHIGQKLGGDTPEHSTAVFLPYRVKTGVKALRLGTLDTFYVASPGDSVLIGRIDLPDVEGLRFVSTESVLPLHYLANWLICNAKAPFMVGMIGKASPVESFHVSYNERLSTFCDAGGGFAFDLESVREAHRAFGGLPWKGGVAGALYDFQRYQLDRDELSKTKLMKAFERHPGLRRAISRVDIRPDSGEYQLLSWMYREMKEKSNDSISTDN